MKFPRLFPPAPVFENEDKNTEAQLTHVILMALFGITVLTGLTPFFAHEMVLSKVVLYLVLLVSIGLMSGMFILLQRGYVRLTNWILVSLYWIIITGLIFATGGMRSQAFFGYFAAIALAGMLLGGRASVGVTIACVVTSMGMLYIGENNLLPSVSVLPPLPIVWFSASSYLIILAVLQNLAARILRQALHRARTSEAQYRRQRDFALQVMNTIGQGLTITGHEGWEYVNPAFIQMIGYPAEELLGKKPADFTIPEDHPILIDARERRLAGETNTYEARLQHANGKIIPTLITAVPRWEEGRVTGAIAIITDLTERIQIEEALRASESLYRQAIEAADAVPYRLSHASGAYENPYSFMGEGIQQMTGYAPHEMTPKVWDSLILESKLRGQAIGLTMNEAVRRAREGKMTIWQCDYRIRTRSGETRWIADTAVEILNERGISDGSIGIMQDITDRKQAQETLEREHYLLRMIIDYLPDYIYLKDAEQRCLVSNIANARTLGTTPEELVGKTLADFYPPEEAEQYNTIEQQVMATGQAVVNQENSFFAIETNKQHWTLMSRVPFRAKDGTVIGVIGISHDITDRKLAEIALAEQAEETAMLYEVSGKLASAAVNLDDLAHQIAKIVVEDLKLAECGVWMVDEEQKALRRIAYYGYALNYIPFDILLDGPGLMTAAVYTGELIYVPDVRVDSRYLPGDANTLSEIVVPLRVQERVIGVLNIENPELDGVNPRQQRVMAAFAERAALALENARLVESLETAVAEVQQLNFVLEKRVAERTEALEHRTTQLEEANKELEAFSYSVSHDLRTPLRAIDGFSTILVENYAEQLPPDAQRFLKRVSESAQRMNHLVNDLLAFSRLTRKDLNKQQVAPLYLVHEVLQELQRDQTGREIEWIIRDLPECYADPSLLRQVYANLIGNALKFTRQKHQARIEISSQEKNGETIYFISDNGAGFDMQYADKLFGVFQRLHTSDEFEGTGIGLANVKRIITRHGGRIWAEAEVERGATFYFTLPQVERLK
jgi:PAS domain S-box-containing protein